MRPLRQSLLYLFLQVLVIVFVTEAGVMLILPSLLSERVDSAVQAFADSCLLTLLSAPLLWWSIIRSLRRLAVAEQAKAQALGIAAPEGIITFNHRGLIESFSPGAEQIFGVTAVEIVGTDLETLIPWQFLVRQQHAPTAETGSPHTHGNLSHASRILGINRRTLRVTLHSLGIEISGE